MIKEQIRKVVEETKSSLEKVKSNKELTELLDKVNKNVSTLKRLTEDKEKSKVLIQKLLDEKIKGIENNPNLSSKQKELAKEVLRKQFEEVKSSIDNAKNSQDIEKAFDKVNPSKVANDDSISQKVLPNTGSESTNSALLGMFAMLFGFVLRNRKRENNSK